MYGCEDKKTQRKIMKTQVIITIIKDELCINAPYSAVNNKIYREKGGRFNQRKSVWEFASTSTTEKMISELFGNVNDLVEATVKMDQIDIQGAEWHIGGYKLASRRGRDYLVEIPTGVQLKNGSFPSSGGSMKNPQVAGNNVESMGLICARDFAERENLEIINIGIPVNPLAHFTYSELVMELMSRNVMV